jgi:hypothetical protein
VLNNPLALVDPQGLYCEGGKLDGSDDDSDQGIQACADGGGQWIEDVSSQIPCPPGSEGLICSQTNAASTNTSLTDLLSNGNPDSDSIFFSLMGAFWSGVPWSATVTFPLVDFGPAASGAIGPTVAVIPKSHTTLCVGLAAGAQVPAEGRTVGGGPLLFGNLNNAKDVLSGGSTIVAAQSGNPLVGAQGMANSSGHLEGPTAGSVGMLAGVSASACSDKALSMIANVLKSAAANTDGILP